MSEAAMKIIPRTMAGLRDALYDVLEKLRDGKMTHLDARQMAGVAKVIIDSVDTQLQFERMKLVDEVPQQLSDMNVVPPITQALEAKGVKKV